MFALYNSINYILSFPPENSFLRNLEKNSHSTLLNNNPIFNSEHPTSIALEFKTLKPRPAVIEAASLISDFLC